MPLKILNALADIDAASWDRLAGRKNPFLRHTFLHGLEESGCVSRQTGWLPQHLLLEDDDRPGNWLGAVPLYLKTHSYGEYIFDWAWANAYHQHGLDYYPKLSAAIPFTPATGSRLLVAPGADVPRTQDLLADAALSLARAHKASSLHWLFLTSEEQTRLAQHHHLSRSGFQFHWYNRDYSNFEDFLTSFSARHRKKVRQDRRYVREAGIDMVLIQGEEATPAHWQQFHEFYLETIRGHGAIPYLNARFFNWLGEHMPESVLLIFARRHGRWIAGSLFLQGGDTLYGRYWGSTEFHSGLHFETCYYRAIEYCIEQGLTRFEAGAQGGHKLARGFVPHPVYSAHWLSHPRFNDAVADYLRREQADIEWQMNELTERAPYRSR